jgi:hypothetical protein
VTNDDAPSTRSGGVLGWLRSRPEGSFVAVTVGVLMAGTVAVLAFDYRALTLATPPAEVSREAAPGMEPAEPFLPSSRPSVPAGTPGEGPQTATPADLLRNPMTFDLVAGGRLLAVGTITPGSAARFASEIEKRGSYAKTVVLDSPGGSVADALAMGRLIRERKLSTAVEPGGRCASSCPLVFAGGVERRVTQGAALGVHQVFTGKDGPGGIEAGMDQAQRISAECQRHLVGMGVDARVWIHAMETPKEALFYFTAEELISLRLATSFDTGQKPEPSARATRS